MFEFSLKKYSASRLYFLHYAYMVYFLFAIVIVQYTVLNKIHLKNVFFPQGSSDCLQQITGLSSKLFLVVIYLGFFLFLNVCFICYCYINLSTSSAYLRTKFSV